MFSILNIEINKKSITYINKYTNPSKTSTINILIL